MANVKISELPAAAALTGTELVALVQAGATVQAPAGDLLALVVDAAPGALDTLDELAAALGDDANFAATVTAALAGKAPAADPRFTGSLVVGGASVQTVSGGLVTPGVQVLGTTTTGSAALTARYDNTASHPAAYFVKSRGATVGAHTVVASGDGLGQISFQASDGAGFIEAARVHAHVDGTPGSNDMPGRLVFSTTADGAAAVTERMRITHAGYVQIGGTTGTAAQLFVQSDGSVAPALILRDSRTSGAADVGVTVEFNFHDGSSNRQEGFIHCRKENGTSGNVASYLSFHTRTAGAGAPAERLRLDSAGYIRPASLTHAVDDAAAAAAGVPVGALYRNGSVVMFRVA